MDLIGFIDYLPNPVVSDRDDVSTLTISFLFFSSRDRTCIQHPPPVDYFNLDLSAFNDAISSQPSFWLTQPSPPPTENSSTFFWETTPDAQTTEQNVFPFLSATSSVSGIHAESTTIPANDVARNYRSRYGNVIGEDAGPASNMHFSIAFSATPLVRFMSLLSSGIFSFRGYTAGFTCSFSYNISS